MARKILLADDSVTAQNMGRKILTDAGYDVVAVNNGSAALKKIIELKPDLIVLDVYMPGYSGLEVCQRIKDNRDTARIPVLLTVGKLEPFKPEEARRAHADAFVVKPFEASELLTAITKLEEKLAPQPEPYKPGRFAKAVAALDESETTPTEKFGDSDSGWKSRIRFPGRKKQAEPEEAPEIPTPAKSVRDFREESFPAPPAAPRHSVPEFERPIPSGIPRDITPEEIAAISAAAARLSGAAPDSVEHPPVREALAAQVDAPSHPPSAELTPFPATTSIDLPELSLAGDLAPITFASAPTQGEKEISGESQAQASSSELELQHEKPADAGEQNLPAAKLPESPTRPMEVAATLVEAASVTSEVAVAAPPELTPSQAISSEIAAQSTESVQALAVEPPVATEFAAFAAEPSATPSEKHFEVQPEAQAPVPAELPSAAQPELQSEAPSARPAGPPEVAIDSPSAAAVPAPITEVIAPQDEEVMAALQNLIPSGATDEVRASKESSELPSGLVAAVAEFAKAGVPVLRPRWIAEESVVTAEEASLSLEQEMEKAYAGFAATEAARLLATSAIESLTPQSASAAATALAEIPAAPLPSHNFAIINSAPQIEHAAVSDAALSAAPLSETLQPLAAAVAAGEGCTDSVGIPLIPEPIRIATDAPPPVAFESVAAEISAAPEAHPEVAESVPQRPVVTDFIVAASSVPAVTESEPVVTEPAVAFEPVSNADATPLPVEPVHTDSHPPVREEPAEFASASADASQETISAGGTDSMAKNSESGLGFKMIRQSPAGSKAAPAAPVTKETFDAPSTPAAEPAAMAAAASAESVSAVPPLAATVADPRAIASIVDSVLAELRPKIVEEIARKLAEPQK